jgi:hypothetical protein
MEVFNFQCKCNFIFLYKNMKSIKKWNQNIASNIWTNVSIYYLDP